MAWRNSERFKNLLYIYILWRFFKYLRSVFWFCRWVLTGRGGGSEAGHGEVCPAGIRGSQGQKNGVVWLSTKEATGRGLAEAAVSQHHCMKHVFFLLFSFWKKSSEVAFEIQKKPNPFDRKDLAAWKLWALSRSIFKVKQWQLIIHG